MISAIAAVETGFQSKQGECITRFPLCWLETRKSGLTRRAAGAAMNRGEAAPDAARRTRRGCGRGLPFRRLSEAGGKPLERPRDIGAIDGNIVEKMNRFRVVVDDDCLRGARNFPDRRPATALHLAEPGDPFVLFSQISQYASGGSAILPSSLST